MNEEPKDPMAEKSDEEKPDNDSGHGSLVCDLICLQSFILICFVMELGGPTEDI